eukprot:11669289-Karenia_brevis.AAC.1
MGVGPAVWMQKSCVDFLKAGPEKVSVSPLTDELSPIVWDRHGVGGEVGGEESGGEDLPEGVEPERLRLHGEGELVKKIADPMLPTEQEVKEHYEMGHA